VSDYGLWPIGTVVVEVRTYVKVADDTWIRQSTGEDVRDGWIGGLFSDGVGTIVPTGADR